MSRASAPPDVLAPNANRRWPNISSALSGVFLLKLLEPVLQRAALLQDINPAHQQNDSNDERRQPVTALKYERSEKETQCHYCRDPGSARKRYSNAGQNYEGRIAQQHSENGFGAPGQRVGQPKGQDHL